MLDVLYLSRNGEVPVSKIACLGFPEDIADKHRRREQEEWQCDQPPSRRNARKVPVNATEKRGSSREPNQRAGRMPLANAPRYTSGMSSQT